ncbi:MAG: PEP-CTERM sorting domain-containing protein [Phycisphaerales bacterium]|nr:PEP-CTERM sorting domain-containing protein [Phycisphaerales bacterium]
MKNKLGSLYTCCAVFFALTSYVSASPWSNPTGTNERFAWYDGQNQSGRFGDPVNINAGLFFTNTVDFRASVSGNPDDLGVHDIAQALVNTDDVGAVPLNHYNVREWGRWHIPEGSGLTPHDAFTVQADISVLRTVPSPLFTQLDITGVVMVFNPDGTWYTKGSILSPPPPGEWTEGLFKASSTLQVDGSAPSGTWIQLDGMQMTLPEPGSMALLLAGCSFMLLRRRHRA